MKDIARIVAIMSLPIKMHKYMFKNTEPVAHYNTKWLKHYKLDFVHALGKHKHTMLNPGSEFENEDIVKPLRERHKYWP